MNNVSNHKKPYITFSTTRYMVSCKWQIKVVSLGGFTLLPFKNRHMANYGKNCEIFCGTSNSMSP